MKRKVSNNSIKMWSDSEFKLKRKLESQGLNNPFFGKTHSESTISALREKANKRYLSMSREQKIRHFKSLEVSIDGIEFESTTKAASVIGVSRQTITNRIKSNKFPNYKYVIQQLES